MSRKINDIGYLVSKKDSLMTDYQFLINLCEMKTLKKRKKVIKNYYEEDLSMHIADFDELIKKFSK
jgi:hypothetical protein